MQSEKKGLLAEWLGAGLQNRLLRFESGRDLSIKYLLWYLMRGKSDLRTFVRRFFCGMLDIATKAQIMNNEQGTRKLEVRSKFGGKLFRVPFEILTSLFMIQRSVQLVQVLLRKSSLLLHYFLARFRRGERGNFYIPQQVL